MRSNLFVKWSIFSIVSLALASTAYIYGIADIIFNDNTYITHGITIFALVGVVYSGIVCHQVDSAWKHIDIWRQEFSKIRMSRDSTIAIELLREQLRSYTYVIRYFIVVATMLGLLGTIVGVIILTTYVPKDQLGNTAVFTKAITGMMSGFGTAFYTTLVGAIGAIWLKTVSVFIERELSFLYRDILSDGA